MDSSYWIKITLLYPNKYALILFTLFNVTLNAECPIQDPKKLYFISNVLYIAPESGSV